MGISLAFSSGHLRIDPKLFEVVHVDKENMTEQECSPSRKSTEKPPPHPFYIPDGGQLNYFIDFLTIILLDSDRRSMARRWGLLDGYDVVKAGLYDTVRYPPSGCIVVSDPTFNLDIRFSLTSIRTRSFGVFEYHRCGIIPKRLGLYILFRSYK